MISGSDEDVFMITEAWTIPGTFEKFKAYRIEVLKILEPYNPEFLFYCHPFDWSFPDTEEELARGMEVCRFKNEETARRAIEAIQNSGIREKEKEVFHKVRSYIGRFAR